MAQVRLPGSPEEKKGCQVVLMGDASVGKTSLIHGIVENRFIPFVATTTGAAVFHYTQTNHQYPDIDFWDTAGMEKFKSLNSVFFRNSVAALIVFDLTNKLSFENVESWCDEFIEKSSESRVLLLVGNKNECEAVIAEDDIRQLAQKRKLEYFSVSAKTGNGVELLLESLSRKLPKVNSVTTTYFQEEEKPNKGCC